MLSVEQTVRALRREILAALADDAPLPGGVSLVADRVSVALGLQFPAAADDRRDGLVVATDPSACLHHLTLEFKLQPVALPGPLAAGAVADAPGVSAVPPTLPPVTAESESVAALSEVFGAPGFDSSARATVFREALEELGEAQRGAVLASLGSPAPEGEEPALGRARQLVLRLAGSGPAGPKRGPELLRQLAGRVPAAVLIRLAAERWRTQSEWAAASVSPV
jgi:hypothetical protein